MSGWTLPSSPLLPCQWSLNTKLLLLFFLVAMCSLPTKLFCVNLDEGGDVAVPLEGGHGNHPGLVLGVVAGGGEDGPLLSGNVGVAISPTPRTTTRPLWRQ